LRRSIQRKAPLGWRYTSIFFNPPYFDMSSTDSKEQWLATQVLN
jgi:tRNA1(Val) A37 N6-methylase TrmN6